jgi:hypothetical protein
MTSKRLLAAALTLAMSFGIVASAMAQTQSGDITIRTQQQGVTTTTTTLDPSYRSTVNVNVIDNNAIGFQDRISQELVDRPAPQVGQTRAAIEAIYGPAQTALAPGKSFDIYTNETDLTGGKMFNRNLTPNRLHIYEVSYNAAATKTATDKAVDVKERVIPRIGDHKNLVTKMLGQPINAHTMASNSGPVLYGIPKQRYTFYNDVLSSPFTAVNTYYNTDGFLVGQEFVPLRMRGQHAISSAGRYIPVMSDHQPDVKVAY